MEFKSVKLWYKNRMLQGLTKAIDATVDVSDKNWYKEHLILFTPDKLNDNTCYIWDLIGVDFADNQSEQIDLKTLSNYREKVKELRLNAGALFDSAVALYGNKDGKISYPLSYSSDCVYKLYGLTREEFIDAYIFKYAFSVKGL